MPDDRFLHKRAGHSQRVNLLTDLEYRVWTQYMLSADDFGVMRGTHHPLQNDNDHLANRPAKVIQRCLDALVTSGLLQSFAHQGKPYVFQHDWQTWQKVSYPRTTTQPKPPDDALATCDHPTQALFLMHPGGAGRRRSDLSEKIPPTVPERSENVPETFSESSALTRAGAPAKRLTANGSRRTANGSEGGPGETDPPMDAWARELVNLYPAQGRCGWNLVEQPLFAAITDMANLDAVGAWMAIQARLEQHKRSHQWRVKQMIPRLDKWLREGLYLQELPEVPVTTVVSEKTARSLTSAAAFVKGGGHAT